jgi:hypothetical protein
MGQRHALAALYSRERPSTHCTGGWVGPRADLDRCGKSCRPPGFDPETVQPVASRYTDHVTRPTEYSCQSTKCCALIKNMKHQKLSVATSLNFNFNIIIPSFQGLRFCLLTLQSASFS